MHLVVFDVDGTLIDRTRSEVGDNCFWAALRETLCLPFDDTCWVDGLRHVTARCIALQLCEQRYSRTMTETEIGKLIARYDELLAQALATEERSSYGTKGALELMGILDASPDHACAIATGCFESTARRKLGKAGLDLDLPLAASDRLISREEIMIAALNSATERQGQAFRSVTYVGDGIWDLTAASNLGWHFVGICAGAQAEELRHCGAAHVHPQFDPVAKILMSFDQLLT